MEALKIEMVWKVERYFVKLAVVELLQVNCQTVASAVAGMQAGLKVDACCWEHDTV